MNKKKWILITMILFGVIVLGLATSYAIFVINVTKDTDFKIKIGSLELKISDTETQNKIFMNKMVPTKDQTALEEKGYEFTITNTGTIDSYYTVYLDDIFLEKNDLEELLGDTITEEQTGRLKNEYVKINLYNHKSQKSNTSYLSDFAESEERKLETGYLKPQESITYTLRIWVAYEAGNDAEDKYFAAQIRVVGEQKNAVAYTESILNGTDPVLTKNLIPVTIEDDGTVKKADIYEPWYSYEQQRWANAVIIRSSYDTLNSYGKVHGATKNKKNVSFDGQDDYINLGLKDYDFQSSITLAIRVKIDEIPTSEQVCDFFGNWDGAGGGISYAENRIHSQFYINGSSSGYKLVSYSITDWEEFMKDYHTLVTTYDGNTIKLYIDGKEVAKSEVSGTIQESSVAFALGANFDSYQDRVVNHANVSVESAVIYDRALNEDEIQKNFKEEIKVESVDELLVYENFNEKEYDANEVIPEDSIESYFVWIPKYSYQLWDLGNYSKLEEFTDNKQEIKIKFGTTNTNNNNMKECEVPLNDSKTQALAGASGSCKVGDYMTHPAFLTFDNNSTGFWVGKFETGYDGAAKKDSAQVDSKEKDKIIIKPNVYSWRNISIGNAFQASYEYLLADQSHMMKNTEWGAVAYLQHSIYGSQESVRVNNNSSYITGYAAVEEPAKGYSPSSIDENQYEGTELNQDGTQTKMYNTVEGYKASTTGNITGVYDMSGGALEYVMGYTTGSSIGEEEQSKITTNYPEFFNDERWQKYYDSYTTTINLQYNNRILGDATGEMGPFGKEQDPDDAFRNKGSWYRDYGNFVYPSGPWFTRSGDYSFGSSAGAFASGTNTGGMNPNISFRIVLTP